MARRYNKTQVQELRDKRKFSKPKKEGISQEAWDRKLGRLLAAGHLRINGFSSMNMQRESMSNDYGVFGKFDVCLADKPYTRYWILNPFLSFNGTVIDSVIVKLFKGTHVERAFNDPNYVYNTTKYNLHLVTK